MPRPHLFSHAPTPTAVLQPVRTSYVVVRQQDLWFIRFEGEEYGPYKTEREAKLFAIDAAHLLAQQGEDTQVLMLDESGELRPVWTGGHDSYPPAL
jgi:hypothetical protein